MKLTTEGEWIVVDPDTGESYLRVPREELAVASAVQLANRIGKAVTVVCTVVTRAHPPDPEIPAWYSDPIVITEGGTYTGRWRSDDPSVPAVTVKTSEPVTILDSEIQAAGHHVTADWVNADLTIQGVRGEAINPGDGNYPGRFVHVEGFTRVEVVECEMVGTSGMYFHECEGGQVRILRNHAVNIDGRVANDGVQFVQFVQVNNGRNLVDSIITLNVVENKFGVSRPEDVISLYKTSGTVESPFVVSHNLIDGAYPADPGDSYSGGGIMLGDGGGAHLVAKFNTVLNTTNYGVAISGGSDNHIKDNVVLATGMLEDGQVLAAQNVGVYIWDMRGDPTWGGNTGSGNHVGWSHAGKRRNDWWVPDADSWTGNEHAPSPVTSEMVASMREDWWASVEGINIGVQKQ